MPMNLTYKPLSETFAALIEKYGDKKVVKYEYRSEVKTAVKSNDDWPLFVPHARQIVFTIEDDPLPEGYKYVSNKEPYSDDDHYYDED